MTFKQIKAAIFSLQGSPQYISKGVALGTFVGMTPLPGLQVFIALALAKLTRSNAKAAAVAVFNTNAFTGLFIFAFNYYLGKKILGFESLPAFPTSNFSDATHFIFHSGIQVFSSLVVGGIIVGLPLAFLFYHISYQYFSNKVTSPSSDYTTNTSSPKYTVITGAGGGLGKALALECAHNNQNLILLGLANENLAALATQLQGSFGISVLYFEVNFLDHEALQKLIIHLNKMYAINTLINNAGVGGSQAFNGSTAQYLSTIIDVNIRATTMITRGLLPALSREKQAYILNIASIAALSPLPYKTIYPASKAFIYSFSRGLKEELEHKNISVSVMLPGPMATNPEITARIKKQGLLAQLSLVPTQQIAQTAIAGMYQKKATIIPGFINKLNAFLFNILPTSWSLSLSQNIVKKEIEVS